MKQLKPANAFEWQRFTDEERERAGGKVQLANTDYKRSTAATKAIERLREGNPTYGTIGISAKTQAMLDMRPKNFTIYSKAGGK
jgi:hypothetical protein